MNMKKMTKRMTAAFLALWMLFACGCASTLPVETAPQTAQTQEAKTEEKTEEKILPDPEGAVAEIPVEGLGLNGWAFQEFTIVYSETQPDYTARAAEWLRDTILAKTGVELKLTTTEQQKTPAEHEIVVGETDREISKALDAGSEGFECSYLARRGHVAMEGNAFAIAAAVVRFAEDYLNGTNVPAEITVSQPITAAPKNFILLIGDGMGQNQTKLFEAFKDKKVADYTDGEDAFYGYLFPHKGLAVTDNIKGSTTDSAASATALATGYKTVNGRIGRSEDDADLLSITELAASRGMATAVMSTEVSSGATPSGFSAHATDRGDTEDILASQKALSAKYGTIISCDYNVYTASELVALENAVTRNLATLFADPDGSFMMYEEAHIDKHCHNNKLQEAFKAVARFNQTIGLVMEQAFYHPETAVIITADHETGGLIRRGEGKFGFSSESHTGAKVPVFAYGQGMEIFHDKTIENVQIPKTLAKLFGGVLAAETDSQYPPLL